MISSFGRVALALDLLPIGVRKWDLLSLFKDPTEAAALTQDRLDQMLALLLPTHGKESPSCDLASTYVKADEELAELQASGDSLVTIFDGPAAYPERLRECYRPPLFLEVRGDESILPHEAIAIVGSRKPTPEGLRTASDMAGQLASAGLAIISGLAYGIDKAAHIGCLDASGLTIAVLGSGIDQIYPVPHEGLAQRIIERGGAVISEFHLHTQPTPYSFPQRNRVISGLSLGVLVVEAAQQSGSLLTAGFALEQNREVFAIPGSIYAPQHVGTNHLIKTGAKLVQTTQDILEELPSFSGVLPFQQDRRPQLTTDEQRILDAIEDGCTSVDLLCARLSSSAHQVLGVLTTLELRGLLIREGPDSFAIVRS